MARRALDMADSHVSKAGTEGHTMEPAHTLRIPHHRHLSRARGHKDPASREGPRPRTCSLVCPDTGTRRPPPPPPPLPLRPTVFLAPGLSRQQYPCVIFGCGQRRHPFFRRRAETENGGFRSLHAGVGATGVFNSDGSACLGLRLLTVDYTPFVYALGFLCLCWRLLGCLRGCATLAGGKGFLRWRRRIM